MRNGSCVPRAVSGPCDLEKTELDWELTNCSRANESRQLPFLYLKQWLPYNSSYPAAAGCLWNSDGIVGRPPERGPQFEALMAQIDSKLTDEGVAIPSRPMLAVREVSIKYGLSMPLGGDVVRMPPDLRQNAALSEAIKQWYEDNYGDRLKVNLCPGQTVVLLDGDLYTLRVPGIFGSVQFVLTRQWLHNPGISRGPVIFNITQLVNEMTPAKAARLTDSALNSIGNAFDTALPAAYTMESTGHSLMRIARGDVEVAVNCMMARDGRYGESKWASLQAAEKVLKAAIDLTGVKFKFTHGLAELCETLTETGLAFDATAQVAVIQCKPGIRYGEEPCSRDEALAAHQASLQLVNILREAGARFSLGLGGSVPGQRGYAS